MATQVALLGNVPEPFDSVKGLVKWQEAHRRKLLQSEHMVHSITSLLLCHAAFLQLYDFHGTYGTSELQSPSLHMSIILICTSDFIVPVINCLCVQMLAICCRLPFQYFDQSTVVRKGDSSHVIPSAASWGAGWCTVPNAHELQERHTLVWISQVRLTGVMTAFGLCMLAFA